MPDLNTPGEITQTDSEVSSVLSAYKSEGDPDVYEGAYTELKRFVEGALDIYKVTCIHVLLITDNIPVG